jgi:hypothetical protein
MQKVARDFILYSKFMDKNGRAISRAETCRCWYSLQYMLCWYIVAHLAVLLTANTQAIRLKIEDTKFVFCRVTTTVAVVSHLLRTEEVPGLNLDRRRTLVYKLFSFCSVVPIKCRKWMAYIKNDTTLSFLVCFQLWYYNYPVFRLSVNWINNIRVFWNKRKINYWFQLFLTYLFN